MFFSFKIAIYKVDNYTNISIQVWIFRLLIEQKSMQYLLTYPGISFVEVFWDMILSWYFYIDFFRIDLDNRLRVFNFLTITESI